MDGDTSTSRIAIHGPEDFAGMRAAGRVAAETLDMITPHVRAGVSTGELDRIIHEYTLGRGATPATLGYRGYPKSSCISLNHVVCHGIPGERRLQDGDILNIDITSVVDGWYGDSSRMFTVGPVSRKAAVLIDVTYDALMRGL
ncbi:MAG: M24 family metallopeptidase, partial [Gluconacetobacter diazotrophicus]|nr:M24 family metallopeptidase [Gluconacetobacter diazotrophicus]